MALSVHIKKKLKDFELAVDFDMDGRYCRIFRFFWLWKKYDLKMYRGN